MVPESVVELMFPFVVSPKIKFMPPVTDPGTVTTRDLHAPSVLAARMTLFVFAVRAELVAICRYAAEPVKAPPNAVSVGFIRSIAARKRIEPAMSMSGVVCDFMMID